MDYVSNVNIFSTSYGDDEDSADVILVDQTVNTMSDVDIREKFGNISTLFSPEATINFSISPDTLNSTVKNFAGYRDPLSIIIPISICYFIIFVTGILGNVITCFVIAKNKTMHTATNYYLFNLAVSDFLVLIFGK
jgi:hypothetical protein